MTGDAEKQDSDQAINVLLSEFVSMVVAYVKQETVVPIKALGRFVLWGVLGAVLLAVGGGLLTLAAVRLAQSETGRHLSGNLSWVPYTAGILVAGVGAGWAASRIGKGRK